MELTGLKLATSCAESERYIDRAYLTAGHNTLTNANLHLYLIHLQVFLNSNCQFYMEQQFLQSHFVHVIIRTCQHLSASGGLIPNLEKKVLLVI